MSSPSTFDCFGLVIHGFAWNEISARIFDASSHGQPTWIVTANPEILLAAKRNPSYWQAIRQADLRIVDGFGLQLIGWLFQASPKRMRGVDLAEQVVKQSAEKGWKVAFIGGSTGVADKAAWAMRQKYPSLRVIAEQGGIIDPTGNGDDTSDEMLQRLTMEAPDVMLVAFGHPKQELWIARHIHEFPTMKVAIGVGGTFDYWTGKMKNAPTFIQSIGLEWLWRITLQPSRWKRILDAVIIFPISAIADRISGHKKTS